VRPYYQDDQNANDESRNRDGYDPGSIFCVHATIIRFTGTYWFNMRKYDILAPVAANCVVLAIARAAFDAPASFSPFFYGSVIELNGK